MSDKEAKTVSIENMTPIQSLEAIWTLMNRAASKGCYTIDESYVIKVLFTKLSQHLGQTNLPKHDLSEVLNQESEKEKPTEN